MKFSSSLKLNHIFQRLYHTRGVADGYLVLYARKNRTRQNRVGLTVSKKLGKAHIRTVFAEDCGRSTVSMKRSSSPAGILLWLPAARQWMRNFRS